MLGYKKIIHGIHGISSRLLLTLPRIRGPRNMRRLTGEIKQGYLLRTHSC